MNRNCRMYIGILLGLLLSICCESANLLANPRAQVKQERRKASRAAVPPAQKTDPKVESTRGRSDLSKFLRREPRDAGSTSDASSVFSGISEVESVFQEQSQAVPLTGRLEAHRPAPLKTGSKALASYRRAAAPNVDLDASEVRKDPWIYQDGLRSSQAFLKEASFMDETASTRSSGSSEFILRKTLVKLMNDWWILYPPPKKLSLFPEDPLCDINSWYNIIRAMLPERTSLPASIAQERALIWVDENICKVGITQDQLAKIGMDFKSSIKKFNAKMWDAYQKILAQEKKRHTLFSAAMAVWEYNAASGKYDSALEELNTARRRRVKESALSNAERKVKTAEESINSAEETVNTELERASNVIEMCRTYERRWIEYADLIYRENLISNILAALDRQNQ